MDSLRSTSAILMTIGKVGVLPVVFAMTIGIVRGLPLVS